MKEAAYYEKAESSKVTCRLCAHNCRIDPDRRGICKVRENRDGTLYTLVYGKLIATNIDPVEKKPLFHFLPGSETYSISTVGCNFQCLHCQNYHISQFPRFNRGAVPGDFHSPGEIVAATKASGCKSISYTYVEPLIFFEYARDCALLARQEGLKNIFVSNGFMNPEVIGELSTFIDAINIDLKAFTQDFYHKVCKARLEPVLDTVRLLHDRGVWVEITTLLIPGLNDSEDELRKIASFIKNIDPAMPWHVTAFHPTYKMTDRPATSARSLQTARQIGIDEGLRFVYEGNIPGEGGENTYCPACGKEIIKRIGFRIQGSVNQEGRCPECSEPIEGVWKIGHGGSY
ncbi:MAG: AmmeMemoRadiSam system radical SAM enzyme [Desulfobulbaceae bacterium]|nr:AmmeMemoRadiSam system radical SAM enzyme [Desulfobulbaceae bacterium]